MDHVIDLVPLRVTRPSGKPTTVMTKSMLGLPTLHSTPLPGACEARFRLLRENERQLLPLRKLSWEQKGPEHTLRIDKNLKVYDPVQGNCTHVEKAPT
jgi:hypothetical protein